MRCLIADDETFFEVGFRSKITVFKHFREHLEITSSEEVQNKLLEKKTELII